MEMGIKITREYQENMREWVSERSYKNLSDPVKDAYTIFCKWWTEKQKPLWTVIKWEEIPEEILKVWNLILEEGCPDFDLIVIGYDKKIGLISSIESSID